MPDAAPFVLVVDDYPDAAESTSEVLSLCGFQVRTARSCAEALTACADVPAAVVADALLLDATLTDRLAAMSHPVPVIVYGDEKKPMCAACASYLIKPADPRELVELLRKYVPVASPAAA